MRLVERAAAGVDAANRALGRWMGWAVLAMVGIGAFNAVARYAGRYVGVNLSSNALLEAQWYLFAAAFLLAAPATLAADRHVRVDVLYGRLSDRGRAWVDVVGTIAFLLPVCVAGIVLAWPSVRDSWAILEQSSDPGGLPRYPVKTLLPVSLALLALQGCAQLPARIAAVRSGSGRSGSGPSVQTP